MGAADYAGDGWGGALLGTVRTEHNLLALQKQGLINQTT